MRVFMILCLVFSLFSCGMGGEPLTDQEAVVATQAMLDVGKIKSKATGKAFIQDELKNLINICENGDQEELSKTLASFKEQKDVTLDGVTGKLIFSVAVNGDGSSTDGLKGNLEVIFTVKFLDYGIEANYKDEKGIARKSKVSYNGTYKFKFKIYASIDSKDLKLGYDISFLGSNIKTKIILADENKTILDKSINFYFRSAFNFSLTEESNAKLVARINGKDLTKADYSFLKGSSVKSVLID